MTAPIVSPGKRLHLQRASTVGDVFTILAIDHIDALRRLNTSGTDADLITFKQQVLNAFRPHMSGILLDPVLGAAQAVQAGLIRHIGLLLELERADYGDKPVPLDLEIRLGWSVEQIKRMAGDGVKVFFYYNSDHAEHSARQEEKMQQVIQQCTRYDIPLYAEPIIYEGSGVDMQRLVIEAARRFSSMGADILKLEFPIDIRAFPDEKDWLAACQQLTSAIEVPWVLLSAGVDFGTFARQVEVACRAGASGFIAGRSVWGDAASIQDLTGRANWLVEEGVRRMGHLTDLAVRYARPWSHVYNAVSVNTDWYFTY